MKKNRSGFTLVEVAFSMAFIALVAAVVVTASTMITQAKNRKVVGDIQKIRADFATFHFKYNAIPGDMDNAYDYWGSDCDSDADDCNGNNSKVYESTYSDPYEEDERFRAWQHLYLAGIVSYSYTGTATSVNSSAVGVTVSGTNVPVTPYDDGGYYFNHRIPYSNSSWENQTNVRIGKNDGDNTANAALLTPKQAKSIDEKMDDGMPNTGDVRGHRGTSYSGNCKNNGGVAMPYTLNNTGIACYMFFPLPVQ